MLRNKKFSAINLKSYNLSAKAQFRLLKAILKNFGWNQPLDLNWSNSCSKILLELEQFAQDFPQLLWAQLGHKAQLFNQEQWVIGRHKCLLDRCLVVQTLRDLFVSKCLYIIF